MAKKYKLRPTGRKYPRPVRAQTRMNPYRARPGLNTYSSARSRYFSPLPKMMQLKTPWYADCRYFLPYSNTGAAGTVAGACGYWFIDPLDMSRPCATHGTGVGGKYFFSPDLGGFLSLYQEARFRTHVLNINFTVDNSAHATAGATAVDLANPMRGVLHIAVMAVPLTYLRKTDLSSHTIAETGQLFQGVDYYAALSQQPGCKQLVIPLDGSQNSIKGCRVELDGYEHNGAAQTIRASMTWAPAANEPTINVAYPDPTARNVFLIATRVIGAASTTVTNQIYIRTEMKIEQHLVFTDKFPCFPYVVDTVT